MLRDLVGLFHSFRVREHLEKIRVRSLSPVSPLMRRGLEGGFLNGFLMVLDG
jgi:hypothetical protein